MDDVPEEWTNMETCKTEYMIDLKNYSLLKHNTFGIQAFCDRFLEYYSVDEAVQVARVLSQEKSPYLLIGGGSNLLLTSDFHGIVVHSAIKGIEVVPSDSTTDNVYVKCGSGEVWDDVVAFCVSHDFYGLENLSAIPGEVGASAVQNIGAYGVEAKDAIVSMEVVEIETGRCLTIRAEECDYAYRQSKFKKEWKNRFLLTSVTYALSKTFKPSLDYGNVRSSLQEHGIEHPTAQQLRDTITAIRAAKLPDVKVEGNAGSFFMNPVVSRDKYEQLATQYPKMPHYTIDDQYEKIPAGWMIDQCGWKGKSLGRAGVHHQQALVLVNRGGATGEDVVRLCKVIQEDVYRQFGIEIIPEVNIL